MSDRFILSRSNAKSGPWQALGRAEATLEQARSRRSYSGAVNTYTASVWSFVKVYAGPTPFFNVGAGGADVSPTWILHLRKT